MGQKIAKMPHSDAASAVNLACSFKRETGDQLPIDRVYLSSRIADMTVSENSLALGLYEDDTLVGALLAQIGDFFSAPVKQSNEVLWYVKPESRGKSAILMIDEYIKWAKSKDVKLIFAGAYNKEAEPIYRRKGFRMIDTNWVLE